LGARYYQAFYYAREFRRAEAECRKVLPHFALAEYYLALSLGWLGRTNEARLIFDPAFAMETDVLPTSSRELMLTAISYITRRHSKQSKQPSTHTRSNS
jgi:hypothetical protein